MLMMPLFTLQVATLFIVQLEFFFRWFEFSFIYWGRIVLDGVGRSIACVFLQQSSGTCFEWARMGQTLSGLFEERPWNGMELLKSSAEVGLWKWIVHPLAKPKCLPFYLFVKQTSLYMRWTRGGSGSPTYSKVRPLAVFFIVFVFTLTLDS